MRHLVLSIAIVISASCTVSPSHDPAALNAASTAAAMSGAQEPGQTDRGIGAGDHIIGVDSVSGSGPPTNSLSSDIPEPQGETNTERRLGSDAVFRGPLPRPTRPNPTCELMPVLDWLGTVLLNTESDQSIDAIDLSPYLAPALAAAQESTGHDLAPTGNAASHRAVLLDARIDDKTSNSALVDAVLTYERTSGTGITPLPGFDIVTLTFTAQYTDAGWQIVDLQISAA